MRWLPLKPSVLYVTPGFYVTKFYVLPTVYEYLLVLYGFQNQQQLFLYSMQH